MKFGTTSDVSAAVGLRVGGLPTGFPNLVVILVVVLVYKKIVGEP